MICLATAIHNLKWLKITIYTKNNQAGKIRFLNGDVNVWAEVAAESNMSAV